jgi:hypothetical protein
VSERTVVEEIEIAGRELVARVTELVREGNVRKVVIRKENGDVLLDLPLTAGAVAGGALVVVAPALAAIGAVAALLAKVKIEVVRTV